MRRSVLLAFSLIFLSLIPVLLHAAPDTVPPSRDTERAALDRASQEYEDEETEPALADVETVLHLNPRSDQAYALRGELQLDSHPTLAEADYKQALALNPKNALALAGLGELETRHGNGTQAKAYFDAAQKADSKLPVLALRQGDYALTFESGRARTDHALAHFSHLIKLMPHRALGYYKRGRVYFELQEYDKALADEDRALQYDPQNAKAFNSRALVYKGLEKNALALADLARAIAIAPDFSRPYYNRALISAETGDLTNALADINRAHARNVTDSETIQLMHTIFDALKVDPEAILSHANELFTQNDYDGAIAQYTLVLQYDQISEPALTNRAICYEYRNQNANAKADFTRLAQYYPENVMAHLQLGEFAVQDGDWTTAATQYQKTLDLDPNNAVAYRGLANTACQHKDYDHAFPLYAKAIALDPQFKEAYMDRGQAYLDTHAWEQAYADYNHVLQLDEKNGKAVWKRSYLYYLMGDYDTAVAEMKRARTLDPSLPTVEYTKEEAATNKATWSKRTPPTDAK